MDCKNKLIRTFKIQTQLIGEVEFTFESALNLIGGGI